MKSSVFVRIKLFGSPKNANILILWAFEFVD